MNFRKLVQKSYSGRVQSECGNGDKGGQRLEATEPRDDRGGFPHASEDHGRAAHVGFAATGRPWEEEDLTPRRTMAAQDRVHRIFAAVGRPRGEKDLVRRRTTAAQDCGRSVAGAAAVAARLQRWGRSRPQHGAGAKTFAAAGRPQGGEDLALQRIMTAHDRGRDVAVAGAQSGDPEMHLDLKLGLEMGMEIEIKMGM